MKKRIIASALLALMLTMLFATTALAAPAAIGKNDFVIRIGKTDFDMLTHSLDVAIYSSGKKLVKYKDKTRNGYEYQLKTKEATFYRKGYDDFASGVTLTKTGKTARGIKIGSTLSALLGAYPKTEDVWDDGKSTLYSYQAPNAPSSLSATVAGNLDETRPDYFYKLVFTVSNKTNKVTGIAINAWY